jgi:hypothetical protein
MRAKLRLRKYHKLELATLSEPEVNELSTVSSFRTGDVRGSMEQNSPRLYELRARIVLLHGRGNGLSLFSRSLFPCTWGDLNEVVRKNCCGSLSSRNTFSVPFPHTVLLYLFSPSPSSTLFVLNSTRGYRLHLDSMASLGVRAR